MSVHWLDQGRWAEAEARMSNGINSSLVQCAALVFSGRGGNITFVLGGSLFGPTLSLDTPHRPLPRCGNVARFSRWPTMAPGTSARVPLHSEAIIRLINNIKHMYGSVIYFSG